MQQTMREPSTGSITATVPGAPRRAVKQLVGLTPAPAAVMTSMRSGRQYAVRGGNVGVNRGLGCCFFSPDQSETKKRGNGQRNWKVQITAALPPTVRAFCYRVSQCVFFVMRATPGCVGRCYKYAYKIMLLPLVHPILLCMSDHIPLCTSVEAVGRCFASLISFSRILPPPRSPLATLRYGFITCTIHPLPGIGRP